MRAAAGRGTRAISPTRDLRSPAIRAPATARFTNANQQGRAGGFRGPRGGEQFCRSLGSRLPAPPARAPAPRAQPRPRGASRDAQRPAPECVGHRFSVRREGVSGTDSVCPRREGVSEKSSGCVHDSARVRTRARGGKTVCRAAASRTRAGGLGSSGSCAQTPKVNIPRRKPNARRRATRCRRRLVPGRFGRPHH